MSSGEGTPRRRGAVLEAAILDAAWGQLADHGLEGFNYESVAARAHTSKPVLYRRWSTRRELLMAAVRHQIIENPVVGADTGSLRGDVIEMLRQANEKRAKMFSLMGAARVYFDGERLTPARLRESAIGGLPLSMSTIMERACRRGEIDVELPQRVVGVPFELMRAEILMSLAPVDESVILSIVDEVFLPLVRAYQGGLAVAPDGSSTGFDHPPDNQK